MFCVYKHTAPNGKIYIGITSDNPVHRWNNGKGYKQNVHFYSAIKKFGWNNIKHEILYDGLTKEKACEKEIELIALYKSNMREFGYNNSIGGEATALGFNHSVETRQRMSNSRKGENCYWYGKHRSQETIEKIRRAKAGKPISEKTKKALLHAVRHQSNETRQKISQSLKGNLCAAKKVICIETGIIYNSVSDAAQKNNIDRSQIGRVCNNNNYCKTAGGFHWEFYEKE